MARGIYRKRLAAGPTIGVPTIALEGDANGAPHAKAQFIGQGVFIGKEVHGAAMYIGRSKEASGTTPSRGAKGVQAIVDVAAA